MRVIQTADGLGFTLKTFTQVSAVGEMFGEDFDGNHAVQPGVGGAIHFAHTAST